MPQVSCETKQLGIYLIYGEEQRPVGREYKQPHPSKSIGIMPHRIMAKISELAADIVLFAAELIPATEPAF
jgi:hypothetical protein